jgi:RNA polymerase sigma-70 factor (ECF subfamily)
MVDRSNETLIEAEPADSVSVTSQPHAATVNQIAFVETPATEGNAACNEQELIELARQGDAAAFGELIKRHYDTCLRRASSLIRNPTDAEDEVQNACWKAFERLRQFRGEGTFAAWLSRIVENQCLMRIREDRQARFLYLDQSTESNVRVELVAQVPGPEDELGDEQLENLLRREISRIPPLLRNVMVLSDVEQLPMPDVAARLGLSVPAAKSRLGRARVELRNRLSKYCGRRGFSTLTYKPRYGRLAYTRSA